MHINFRKKKMIIYNYTPKDWEHNNKLKYLEIRDHKR
jgi:hypothetical protein